MTNDQALLIARRYVEVIKGCTTIGSFPIKGGSQYRHIIGVSASDNTFQVILDSELNTAFMLEICDRQPLSELLNKID